jgi:hypothetical protein
MSCPAGLFWNAALASCDWPHNVACETEVACPEGWQLAGSSCYLLTRNKYDTLVKAAGMCEALGAMLVEINSAEEQAVVVALAEAAATGENDGLDYWVGGVETEEGWRWLSGAAMQWTAWWGEGPDSQGQGRLKSVYPFMGPIGVYPCVVVRHCVLGGVYPCGVVGGYLCVVGGVYPCVVVQVYLCVEVGVYPTHPRGGCIQLLRKGKTEPGLLDTFHWARAATNAKCSNSDSDNGAICEMEGGLVRWAA